MKRDVIDADPTARFWRYSIEHDGEKFHQTIQGLPDDDRLNQSHGGIYMV